MSKGHTLQDPYLNALRKERVPVSIYLVNGIKLQGIADGVQACYLYRRARAQCQVAGRRWRCSG